MQETNLYNENGVTVTPTWFVVSNTTYAIKQLVAVSTTHTHSSNYFERFMACGVTLVGVLGVGFLASLLLTFVLPQSLIPALFAIIMIASFIAGIAATVIVWRWIGVDDTYYLTIDTASGKMSAYSSSAPEEIQQIQGALMKAISGQF